MHTTPITPAVSSGMAINGGSGAPGAPTISRAARSTPSPTEQANYLIFDELSTISSLLRIYNNYLFPNQTQSQKNEIKKCFEEKCKEAHVSREEVSDLWHLLEYIVDTTNYLQNSLEPKSTDQTIAIQLMTKIDGAPSQDVLANLHHRLQHLSYVILPLLIDKVEDPQQKAVLTYAKQHHHWNTHAVVAPSVTRYSPAIDHVVVAPAIGPSFVKVHEASKDPVASRSGMRASGLGYAAATPSPFGCMPHSSAIAKIDAESAFDIGTATGPMPTYTVCVDSTTATSSFATASSSHAAASVTEEPSGVWPTLRPLTGHMNIQTKALHELQMLYQLAKHVHKTYIDKPSSRDTLDIPLHQVQLFHKFKDLPIVHGEKSTSMHPVYAITGIFQFLVNDCTLIENELSKFGTKDIDDIFVAMTASNEELRLPMMLKLIEVTSMQFPSYNIGELICEFSKWLETEDWLGFKQTSKTTVQTISFIKTTLEKLGDDKTKVFTLLSKLPSSPERVFLANLFGKCINNELISATLLSIKGKIKYSLMFELSQTEFNNILLSILGGHDGLMILQSLDLGNLHNCIIKLADLSNQQRPNLTFTYSY